MAAMPDKPAFEVECHCGNLRLCASREPDDLTQCNCSICRRLGALWAYANRDDLIALALDPRFLIQSLTDLGGLYVMAEQLSGEWADHWFPDDDGTVMPSSENRAVTWAYEPGSVMKAMTFSAVLDQGVGSPDSYRDVPHWFNLYDATFTDSHEHATAW